MEETIGRIIANTRRQKRQSDLIVVSADVKMLCDAVGSIEAAAHAVMLSTSMITQFLSIEKLSSEVKRFFKSRLIDSVSIGFYLSKFNPNDQIILAKLVIDNRVNSSELRLLLPLRKQHPTLSISELVDKLQSSQNKKVSVIRFELEDSVEPIEKIRNRLLNLISITDLVSVEQRSSQGEIKVLKSGEDKLRSIAKNKRISFQQLIYELIY